jgi:hypothetical protein
LGVGLATSVAAITVFHIATRWCFLDTGCIRIDDADINGDGSLVASSDVTLVNVLGECMDSFYDKRTADTEINSGANSVTVSSAYALMDAWWADWIIEGSLD